MQNNDKKYFIPVNGNPIEVSEEVYRAYYDDGSRHQVGSG